MNILIDLHYANKYENMGHVLIRHKDDDRIDWFRLDVGFHNGPECAKCGTQWCYHCDENIKPCPGKD